MIDWRQAIQRYDFHRRKKPLESHRLRLSIALLLSFGFHAFILFLSFGAPGQGLPGLAWPWLERRVQATAMTVRLTDVAPPSLANSTALPVTQRVPNITSTPPTPKPEHPLPAGKSFEVTPAQDKLAIRPQKSPARPPQKPDHPVPVETPVFRPVAQPPPQKILAQKDPQQETFNVPPVSRIEPEPPRTPDNTASTPSDGPPAAPDTEATRRQAEEIAAKLLAEQLRIAAEQETRRQDLLQAKELEARKQAEALRLREEKKLQDAQRLALELEAQRQAEDIAQSAAAERERQAALALQKAQELKRLEETKISEETKRIEEAQKQQEAIKREEVRRIAALEAETLRRAQEAARQLAAERQKELESRRQAEEAAAVARARETAERQRLDAEAAARRDSLAAEQAASRAVAGAISGSGPANAPPAPGALSGRDLAAAAIDQLRSQGTARIAPPSPPPRPGPDDNPRRRSIIGVERDVMLRMYVDSWRWRIERNGSLNYSSSAGWGAPDYAVVTVAIRSDGSLESVVIHRSSGLRQIDEAVKRIAQMYAPYSAFQPALARQFDVIEIRRIWNFDGPLRIQEEPR